MYDLYFRPVSVAEGLKCLKEIEGKGIIIAGGTDIIIKLKEKKLKVNGLVDVTNIEELQNITYENEYIAIGSALRHHELVKSKLINEKATVLAEAAHAIGSPQIRNTGTIGGNIANAQPAADTAVALTALESIVEIQSINDKYHQLNISEMNKGVGLSAIDSSKDMIIKFKFKAHERGEGSAFERLSQRKALTLPMINAAVFIRLVEGVMKNVRIAVAPVDVRPLRALEAEEMLLGKEATSEVIIKAAKAAANMSNPRDSKLRGSSIYRRAMVEVLVKRALIKAIERALSSS